MSQDKIIKDKVSVITPLYNGARFVAETIKSVLAQSYKDWEMIIVNDGSTDNSAEIVKEFTETDSRIKLINQANAGSASARNNGIRNSTGQYIALLDADDLWEESFLESQIQFMKQNNAYVVHSSYKRIDEEGKEILRPFKAKSVVTFKNMQMTNHIACLTGLYDSTKFGKIYLREELKSIRDDYAYWLDIVKLTGVSYGNPNVLASYRVMRNSTTGKKTKLIKSQYNFYRKYQKFGIAKSLVYTIYWAALGIIKFSH